MKTTTGTITTTTNGATATASASASASAVDMLEAADTAAKPHDDETADGLPELVVDTSELGNTRTKSNGVSSTDSVDSGLAGDHSSPEHDHGFGLGGRGGANGGNGGGGSGRNRRPRANLKMPPYPGFDWVPPSNQVLNENGSYYYNYEKHSPLLLADGVMMECEEFGESNYASHIVYVHVNLGETLSVRVGDEVQHIPGPATVRMVTNKNAGPPTPLPLHVPPGHIVQQIVDEYGTLRHLVLSPQGPAGANGANGQFLINSGYVSPNVQFVDTNGYYDANTYTTYYDESPNGADMMMTMDGNGNPSACTIDLNDTNGAVMSVDYGGGGHEEYQEPSGNHYHRDNNNYHNYRRPYRSYQASPEIDDHHQYHHQQYTNGGGYESQYNRLAPPRIGGRRRRPTGFPSSSSASASSYHGHRGGGVSSGGDSSQFLPLHHGPVYETVSRNAWLFPDGRFLPGERYPPKPSSSSNRATMTTMTNDRNRLPPSVSSKDGNRSYRGSYHNGYTQTSPTPFRPASAEPISIVSEVGGVDGGAAVVTNHLIASNHDEDEAVKITEMLSRIPPPQVRDISSCAAFVQWQPFDCSEASANGGSFPQIDASEFTYEVLLYEHKLEREPKHNYRCRADLFPQKSLTDLKPATDYFVRLRAMLEERGIIGEPSPAVAFHTKAAEPERPRVPKVEKRSKTWLLIAWQPPPDDNGSRIRSYHLEIDDTEGATVDDESGFMEIYEGPADQYKILDLQPAAAYRIRLAASNAIGKSEYSDILIAKTSGGAPNEPEPPILTEATPSTLCLQWKCRDYEDEYQLFVEDAEKTYQLVTSTRDTTYTITNLTHSHEYRFVLTALNDDGCSPVSKPAAFRTLPPKPPAPSRIVAAAHSSDSARIEWALEKDKEEEEGISYVLEMRKATNKPWTTVYDGVRRTFEVTGLESGTAYRFRVCSRSEGGISEYTEELRVNTPASAPGQCSPPSSSQPPASTVLHLKWSPPFSDGGAGITEYELTMGFANASSDRTIYRGSSNAHTIASGLQPGCEYVFRVRPSNLIGAGPWSEVFECRTAPAPPDCPQRLRLVETTSRSIYLTWESPAFNNGSPVTEYRLHRAVRKMSNVSHSPAHSPVDDRPHPVVVSEPPTMIDEMAKTDPKAASFQRQTSTASNSSELSDDCVFSAKADPIGAMDKIYEGAEMSFEATELTPATEYAFCVQALNEAGESRLSNALFCRTPADVPDSPAILRADAISLTEIVIHWEPPADNGTPIVNYHLEILQARLDDSSGLTFPTALPPTPTRFTVDGLLPATTYRFRIQAVNEMGPSDYSTPVEVATLPPPPPSPKLELTSATHNSLKLRWSCESSMVLDEDDNMIYTLEMENKSGTFSPLATELTTRSYKVIRLNESSSYRFRVRAHSAAAGIGQWSESYVFATLKSPPAAVKYAPKISNITETTCEIEWQAVKLSIMAATNDKVSYDLQIRNVCSSSNASEGVFETIYKGPSTSFRLTKLIPGAAYKIRVSSIRLSDTGHETESAPSPISTFSTIAPPMPSATVLDPSNRDGGAFGKKVLAEGLDLLFGGDNERQISDRQWAMLILMGFGVLALLVAFVLQRFIPEGSPASPSADM